MSLRIANVGLSMTRSGAVHRRALLTSAPAIQRLLQKRSLQTESLPPSEQQNILNNQRLARPSSPHFTIYQPQITWLGSIANRVTGAGLGVLLYGFSIAYLLGPVVGLPFDSAALISAVQTLPEWAKYSGKVILAFPFTYHAFNGLRHLGWDAGKFLTLKGAYNSFYAVIAASVVSGIALVIW